MTTAQIEYTAEELLADHDYVEPLVVGGVRCHGGFTADGTYASPRTKNRWPAIRAWEEARQATFGTPVLDIPLETWPENFPNVEQTKFLLRAGVREPTVSALTRIGTVEGFGVLLRQISLPDFSGCFEEDIAGTAIDHIDRGLFEAHARDEAGHGDEAGHDRMWFIARDIAFEHPMTEDQTTRMLERMGITNGRRGPATAAARILPDDIDPDLEVMASRMIGLLLIEISAFHGFRWAEAVLEDRDLVAGDGEAAVLISRISADETPHVAWLRTALSEMRDRTWVGTSGRHYAGSEMIARLWERALGDSLGVRRQDNLRFILGEIERALDGRPDGADILAQMFSLGTVTRAPDGSLVDAGTVPATDR